MKTLARTLLLSTLYIATAAAQDAGDAISILLSPQALSYSTEDADEEFATRIHYQPEERDGTMSYTPVWEPWNAYMAGKPIQGGDYYQTMSLVADPAYVQLYVINASDEPISIASAEAVVSESEPDLKPIIAVNEDAVSPRVDVADLKNYGWGTVENAVARFNVQARDSGPVYGDYAFEVSVAAFETEGAIDLRPAMVALGMDPDALLQAADKTEYRYDPANVERALGRLAAISERDEEGIVNATVLFAGELAFDWTDAGGAVHRETVPFVFDHVFFEHIGAEMGAAGAVSGRYDVELPISGRDYIRTFPYKRDVDAGATDRIVIGIRSPRSAFHAFRLRLRLSDGREVLSPPCRLHFLVPRGLEPGEEYR